jgi:hypothetical protein
MTVVVVTVGVYVAHVSLVIFVSSAAAATLRKRG